MIKNYIVAGKPSDACRTSDEDEINEIPGTQGVEGELESGRGAVTGEEISDVLVARAVDNAGFQLREQA